jgi:hypothetical protein
MHELMNMFRARPHTPQAVAWAASWVLIDRTKYRVKV